MKQAGNRQQGPIPWQLEGLLYGEVVRNQSDTRGCQACSMRIETIPLPLFLVFSDL
jgi:hypothetical protein